jgi:hypothetical protein
MHIMDNTSEFKEAAHPAKNAARLINLELNFGSIAQCWIAML